MLHIGYKKAKNNLIIKLEILGRNNEGRSKIKDVNYAKMRCEKAKVLEIYDMFTRLSHFQAESKTPWFVSVVYHVGKVVIPDHYTDDIDKVCSPGIHYFLTEKAAEMYEFEPPGDYTGIWTKYAADGQLIYRSNYIKGSLVGLQEEWYQNGNKMSSINRIDTKSKELENYYENGNLSQKTVIKDGRGSTVGYHKNGLKAREFFHQDGVRQGAFKEWSNLGVLMIEGKFKDGVFHGEIYHYDEKGLISKEKKYINGYLVESFDGKERVTNIQYWMNKKGVNQEIKDYYIQDYCY